MLSPILLNKVTTVQVFSPHIQHFRRNLKPTSRSATSQKKGEAGYEHHGGTTSRSTTCKSPKPRMFTACSPPCSTFAFHAEGEVESRNVHANHEKLARSLLVAAMVSLTCETVKTPKSKLPLHFQCRLFPCCWSSLGSRLPIQKARPRRSSRVPFGSTRVFSCGSCQILPLQRPLSSEPQQLGSAIRDTFDDGTQAEAVNRILPTAIPAELDMPLIAFVRCAPSSFPHRNPPDAD